jgi:glycosyltransferase involved in cell wall biosynthesis
MKGSPPVQQLRLLPTGEPRRRGSDFFDVQLVIPVLNEEGRIGRTLEAICAWAESSGLAVGLVIVDNGSADATTECVDRVAGQRIPHQVVGCRTRGKGAAVRAGVLSSRAPVVGYCDADLSTPPAMLGPALELIDDGWDVVLGSRRCAGASYVVPRSAIRRMGSWGFHRLARQYVGDVTDTQCGFKVFRGEVARAVFARTRTAGFAFDVEIVARAQRSGYRVVELPLPWAEESGSTFRPVKDGISSFRDLAALRQALLD